MKFSPFIFCIFLSMIAVSCIKEVEEKADLPPKEFVYLKDKQFTINGESTFPIMMNYIFQYRYIRGKIYSSPTIEYDSLHKYDAFRASDINERFKAHFQLLNEIGFNSIRLVGLNTIEYTEDTGDIFYVVKNEFGKVDTIRYNEAKDFILDELQKVVKMAQEHGLKIMILLPRPRIDETEDSNRLLYIADILKKFKNEPTIFAYDFFNEPLYFDKSEAIESNSNSRTKKEAYQVVLSWKKMMKKFAPYQLFTIGYAEPLEVFEWDPAILPVDFVTFHTYHPLRVPNEIYWYSKYIDKPWMLGETSLPADNDSVLYLEQHQFMKEALRRTINCGGNGFGWWQFQDVEWGPFEHDYTPILNHEGITTTQKGSYKIYGSMKHDVSTILNKLKTQTTDSCVCWDNYYNIVGYNNFLIKGKILNEESGEPIAGAVIRGWNSNWGVGANTFTKEDGSFTLYSNDEFVNFEISAPKMTKIKFHVDLNYKAADKQKSVIALDNQFLEYHDISYQPFLKYSEKLKDTSLYQKEYVLFKFKSNMFNQYKLVGEMQTKYLKPLDFID